MTTTLNMSAHALLDRAADHLETVGWTQRQYIRHVRHIPTGKRGESLPTDQCPVCPRAAIAVAAGVHPKFAVAWPSYRRDVEDAEDVFAAIVGAESALSALSAHLRPHVPPSITSPWVIEFWNDRTGRKSAVVVAEMRACAAALRKAGGS